MKASSAVENFSRQQKRAAEITEARKRIADIRFRERRGGDTQAHEDVTWLLGKIKEMSEVLEDYYLGCDCDNGRAVMCFSCERVHQLSRLEGLW